MRNWKVWTALFALALMSVACGPPAQEQKPPEPAPPTAEEAMESLVKGWDTAMNAGDTAAAVALYVSGDPAIMPPDVPAREGIEALRAHFDTSFEQGPLGVKDWKKGVLAGDRLVMAYGGYTLTPPAGGDAPTDVAGKWICVARRQGDDSLAVVRNIWNVDAPPDGAAPLHPIAATGPAAAEDVPCYASPRAVDEAFQANLIAGNVAAITGSHAADAIRMAPGRPAIEGRQAISDYTQSFMDTFSKRELELTGINESVDGDVGYSWGGFRYTYAPAAGGDQVEGEGKFLSVATKNADGCWRAQWVLWNSDTPWPMAQ